MINKQKSINHKFQGNFLKQGTGTRDILSSGCRGMIYCEAIGRSSKGESQDAVRPLLWGSQLGSVSMVFKVVSWAISGVTLFPYMSPMQTGTVGSRKNNEFSFHLLSSSSWLIIKLTNTNSQEKNQNFNTLMENSHKHTNSRNSEATLGI